jgi:apolipoprotein N-acyltransferase
VFDFDVPASDLARLRPLMASLREDTLALTLREARAGARVVFWSENAVPTLAPEVADGVGRADVLAGAALIAAETGAYVGAAMDVIHPRPVRTENLLTLVGPGGGVELEFHKAHPVFPVEAAVTVGKSEVMSVAATPVGRISAAICHDFDFHRLFFDAGRAGAELVLDPSWDWDAIFPVHSHMARFRAIEQGFALVRGVKEGHALACDALGRIVASVDDRGRGNGVMVASVPVGHAATLYTRLGDALAWACLAALGALAVAAASRRRICV